VCLIISFFITHLHYTFHLLVTDFAEEHPAGPESIIELAGQDGTEAFEAVHSEGILEDFDPVGILY
jgi:hypothetical protein